MKKLTTIIAISLLAALLFTGCDFISLPKDFSHYGFEFTIAGKVTEKEGNEAGNVTLYTNMGTLTFTKLDKAAALIAEGLTSLGSASKETLDNGATFYTFAAKESSGIRIVETYCYIEVEGAVWQLTSATPENDYKKDKIVKIFQSVEFVTDN